MENLENPMIFLWEMIRTGSMQSIYWEMFDAVNAKWCVRVCLIDDVVCARDGASRRPRCSLVLLLLRLAEAKAAERQR